MKVSDVPRINFWPYDIFGYLLPGVLFLVALAVGDSLVSSMLRSAWGDEHWSNILLLAFIAYIVGTCIAAASSYLLERRLLHKTWKYPTARLFVKPETEKGPIERSFFKRFIRWLKFKSIVEWVSPGYTRPYSPTMQSLTETALRKIFSDELPDDHDRFWLSWEYITIHHPIAYKRATHFLELYGFSRNSAMSLLIIAFLPVLHLPFLDCWKPPINGWYWFGLSGVAAVILFSNYTKILRRMNDEVYRGLVTACKAPGTEEPVETSKG